MPNRILRDWTASDRIDQLSPGAEVFFTRLIMKADDFGLYYGNPKLLNSALFPLRDYDNAQVLKWLNECIKSGVIIKYTVDGKDYIQILGFDQRLRLMKSKFPAPPKTDELHVPSNDGQMTDNGRRETKRNEVETETETIYVADKSATIDQRALIFRDKVAEFLPEYPKEMLRAFFDYWTEKNEGGRRLRFEMQKVFDLKRRLKTWSNNEKKRNYGNGQSKLTAQGTLDRLNSYTNDW